MNFFNRLNEYFAFTKNEQKVFLFLSAVFLSGVAIKVYKTYVIPQAVQQFDYSASDSVFNERSRLLIEDTLTASSKGVLRKININTATKTELMTLPGIGEATAERIMLYREEKGSFKQINEMRKVKGIGEKKFEKLKPHIEVK
ncbi:MAG: helix-hairpin-helix domain-containing protein [Ignavibacteriales bacterium]|nr:helix-hairpin-helix domain-containing protein [Ignavibacteriales bacterium]